MKCTIVPLMAALILPLVLSGCRLDELLAPGTRLHNEVYTPHIPGMSGNARIVYTRCFSIYSTDQLAKVSCFASMSNGVSDLINDLHTGVDVLTIATLNTVDVADMLRKVLKSRCKKAAENTLNEVVAAYTGLPKEFTKSYANPQVKPKIAGWFETAVKKAWDETKKNTYSGGHRCATGSAVVSVKDISSSPKLSLNTFSIDEEYNTCPRARVVFDLPWPAGKWHWGNDW